MKFIPAIDLKDNKCVRLKKGNEEEVTIFNDNPLEQAKFFEDHGCKRIHIVDLDGAFGRENINKDTILKIRNNTKIEIELGGGIKTKKDFSFWFDEGIDFLVVGSLAIKNKNLILEISKKYKKKIYLALDILDQKIMIKGWVEQSNQTIDNFLNFYKACDLKGYIFTDISRDGMLNGLDIKLIKNFISKTKKNIIVGGGLTNYKDLHNLKNLVCENLEGVISGKSFYSGNIEIYKALNILDSNA